MPIAVSTPSTGPNAATLASQKLFGATAVGGAIPQKANKSKAQIDENVHYGDFRDELARNGFVVIPGVIPKEDAASYVSRSHDWLESFGRGYNRNDKSTWKKGNLPFCYKGGLYNKYGIGHAQQSWDLRLTKSVRKPFETIWGTEELLVSFDGMNMSIPQGVGANDELRKPWPHVDQSPLKQDLYCVQGIVNLSPNGPEDGGLMVLKGSKPLYSKFFNEAFAKDMPEGGWSSGDRFDHNQEQNDWFLEQGCEWIKVCAEPGDLILWDSRCVHYGAHPRSQNPRIAQYICFKPASHASDAVFEQRKLAWENLSNTSHDPISFFALGKEIPEEFTEKYGPNPVDIQPKRPEIGEEGLKLAGVIPY